MWVERRRAVARRGGGAGTLSLGMCRERGRLTGAWATVDCRNHMRRVDVASDAAAAPVALHRASSHMALDATCTPTPAWYSAPLTTGVRASPPERAPRIPTGPGSWAAPPAPARWPEPCRCARRTGPPGPGPAARTRGTTCGRAVGGLRCNWRAPPGGCGPPGRATSPLPAGRTGGWGPAACGCGRGCACGWREGRSLRRGGAAAWRTLLGGCALQREPWRGRSWSPQRTRRQ